MEKLIIALGILEKYIVEDHFKEYPTSCEHDVLTVHGVNLDMIDSKTVHELYYFGFIPGSAWDSYSGDWWDISEEEWKHARQSLQNCFHSYKYGSC